MGETAGKPGCQDNDVIDLSECLHNADDTGGRPLDDGRDCTRPPRGGQDGF